MGLFRSGRSTFELRLSEGLGRTRTALRFVDALRGLRVPEKCSSWAPRAPNKLTPAIGACIV